jgi:bla regulator protein blaR1
MPNIRRFAWLVGFLAGFGAVAQVPPEPTYGYEVVSVKKSDPEARGVRIGPGPQGGLRTSNTNLMVLLTFAYDVRDYQILDAPGWSKGEGFDVSFTPEKPEAPIKPGEADAKSMETMMQRQRQRMQAVLRDRFGVKLRMETRELPIYGLAIAKNGSKLKEPEAGGKGPSMMMNGDKGELTATGANMRMLTNVLSNILKRPVVDETGIDSTFDMTLQFKPDSFVGGPGTPPSGETPAADVEGASIFTAITEQLGLRLVSKKGPVTVYVVESAERPSEN